MFHSDIEKTECEDNEKIDYLGIRLWWCLHSTWLIVHWIKVGCDQRTYFDREFQELLNGIITFHNKSFSSVKTGQILCPDFAFQAYIFRINIVKIPTEIGQWNVQQKKILSKFKQKLDNKIPSKNNSCRNSVRILTIVEFWQRCRNSSRISTCCQNSTRIWTLSKFRWPNSLCRNSVLPMNHQSCASLAIRPLHVLIINYPLYLVHNIDLSWHRLFHQIFDNSLTLFYQLKIWLKHLSQPINYN
jgi:hypothetical protein